MKLRVSTIESFLRNFWTLAVHKMIQLTDRAIVVVTPNHLAVRDLMAQAVSRLIRIHRHVQNIAWMGREVTFGGRFLNLHIFL